MKAELHVHICMLEEIAKLCLILFPNYRQVKIVFTAYCYGDNIYFIQLVKIYTCISNIFTLVQEKLKAVILQTKRILHTVKVHAHSCT